MDSVLIWFLIVAGVFDIVPSNWVGSDYTNVSEIHSDVIALFSKFPVIHRLIPPLV